MKNPEIYVYGGGGHGKVVVECLERSFGAGSIKGIFDDDPAKKGKQFHGYTIVGSIFDFERDIPRLILAIGDNLTRKKRFEEIRSIVEVFVSAIHPGATISHSAAVGMGTLVMPGVIVNSDARIGNHCILNTGAVIEHDCFVGDFSHIAPGAVLTGAVRIGEATLIGANSTIVPGISVGNHCLVAAGSVVTKDIPDNAIVRGNPAKIIKVVS